MRTWNIANKTVLKYDEYSHWIDYISYWIQSEWVIRPFFTNRIFDLDTDNSNYWVVEFVDEYFWINKYKSPLWDSYTFSVTFNSVSVPIFVITQYNKHQTEFCNNQWWIIHFYGAYFRLIELEHFSTLLQSTIQNHFLHSPIVRLDYRFDFLSYKYIRSVPSAETVLPNMRKNKKIVPDMYACWKIQSWTVWKSKYKTVLIRLYNKLDELAWNMKKIFLYWDIDKFKTFFRLEYEFWHKWCAWYLWKDLPELLQKAYATSWIEPSTFTWNLYKPQIALDLSNKISKLRYVKMFKSMAKNLKKNWIDPISLIK